MGQQCSATGCRSTGVRRTQLRPAVLGPNEAGCPTMHWDLNFRATPSSNTLLWRWRPAVLGQETSSSYATLAIAGHDCASPPHFESTTHVLAPVSSRHYAAHSRSYYCGPFHEVSEVFLNMATFAHYLQEPVSRRPTSRFFRIRFSTYVKSMHLHEFRVLHHPWTLMSAALW